MTFGLRVLGSFLGLAIITAVVGFGVRALSLGLDIGIIQAVAAHRDATVTSIAEIVTYAGSFSDAGIGRPMTSRWWLSPPAAPLCRGWSS